MKVIVTEAFPFLYSEEYTSYMHQVLLNTDRAGSTTRIKPLLQEACMREEEQEQGLPKYIPEEQREPG